MIKWLILGIIALAIIGAIVYVTLVNNSVLVKPEQPGASTTVPTTVAPAPTTQPTTSEQTTTTAAASSDIGTIAGDLTPTGQQSDTQPTSDTNLPTM